MPRIDDLNLSLGKFKKSSVRSWDDDLVSSLRINSSDKGAKDPKHVIQGDASTDIQTKPVDEDEKLTRGDKLGSQCLPESSKQKKSKKTDSNISVSSSRVNQKKESQVSVARKSNTKSSDKVDSSSDFKSTDGNNRYLNLARDDSTENLIPPSFLDEDFRYRKILKRLPSQEKAVLGLIVAVCIQKKSLKTGDIPSDDFDDYLGFTRNSRETAIKRLCKKGIVKRLPGKRGVHGVLSFSFTNATALDIAKEYFS